MIATGKGFHCSCNQTGASFTLSKLGDGSSAVDFHRPTLIWIAACDQLLFLSTLGSDCLFISLHLHLCFATPKSLASINTRNEVGIP